MVIKGSHAVVAALADSEMRYMFGVIAAGTSQLGRRESEAVGSTPYLTPFGF